MQKPAPQQNERGDSARRREGRSAVDPPSNLAKRLECAELAPAFWLPATPVKSAGKPLLLIRIFFWLDFDFDRAQAAAHG
jgi:hypothetical protein